MGMLYLKGLFGSPSSGEPVGHEACPGVLLWGSGRNVRTTGGDLLTHYSNQAEATSQEELGVTMRAWIDVRESVGGRARSNKWEKTGACGLRILWVRASEEWGDRLEGVTVAGWLGDDSG